MGDDELAIRRAYVELQAAQARTAALTAAVADVERVRQIVRGRADAGARQPSSEILAILPARDSSNAIE